MIVTILLFVLIFGLLVFCHEIGHFFLARANGIYAKEFFIGFGPKLFHFEKGGTEFSLRMLPIGGACVFEGDDQDPALAGEHSFSAAGVWARAATIAAGPFFNFILAYVLALVIVSYAGTDRPIIQNVMDGYPAQEAGIEPGDLITRIGRDKIQVSREIALAMFSQDGSPVEVEYERDGKRHQVVLVPKLSEEEDRYLLGFLGYGAYEEAKGLDLFRYAAYEVRYYLHATVKSLGMLIRGRVGAEAVSGPVGMAQVIGEVRKEASPYGFLAVLVNMLNIAMLLSVNLGVMNLLPLPALDGGRLMFILVEALRGKPVPPEKEGMVHFAGFVLLMIVMVFVLFNDISRLFG